MGGARAGTAVSVGGIVTLAVALGAPGCRSAASASLPALPEPSADVGAAVSVGWFAPAPVGSPWTQAVASWQRRASGDAGEASAAESELAASYRAYRAERRRALARDVSEWIRAEAERHFVPDAGADHWPTFGEVLARGRDDCDGLALVARRMLLELGLEEEHVWQAVVRRAEDGLLHMVVLWFEDGEDPWVIDPTGAATTEFVRFSSLAGWSGVRLFSEAEQFAVAPGVASPAATEAVAAESEGR